MHKILLYNKFVKDIYIFRALCAHHKGVKIEYTASGIITPVGGRPVHRLREESFLNLCTGRPQSECGDTRCCIYNFDLLMMSTWCSKHVEAFNKLIIKQDFVHQVDY